MKNLNWRRHHGHPGSTRRELAQHAHSRGSHGVTHTFTKLHQDSYNHFVQSASSAIPEFEIEFIWKVPELCPFWVFQIHEENPMCSTKAVWWKGPDWTTLPQATGLHSPRACTVHNGQSNSNCQDSFTSWNIFSKLDVALFIQAVVVTMVTTRRPSCKGGCFWKQTLFLITNNVSRDVAIRRRVRIGFIWPIIVGTIHIRRLYNRWHCQAQDLVNIYSSFETFYKLIVNKTTQVVQLETEVSKCP